MDKLDTIKGVQVSLRDCRVTKEGGERLSLDYIVQARLSHGCAEAREEKVSEKVAALRRSAVRTPDRTPLKQQLTTEAGWRCGKESDEDSYAPHQRYAARGHPSRIWEGRWAGILIFC